MAKLPYLPGEPHHPFPFPKRMFRRKIALRYFQQVVQVVALVVNSYDEEKDVAENHNCFPNFRFLARQEGKVMVTPSLKLKCTESAS